MLSDEEVKCQIIAVLAFPAGSTSLLHAPQKHMPSEHGISWAGNTNNPCLLVLREQGYELSLEPRQQGSLWCASKDGVRFMAHSGAELLGLVTLWQRFGINWNQQVPDVFSELVDRMEDI